jgi:uncharacterized protein (TIGR00730 family)
MRRSLKTLGVFLGSSPGVRPEYEQAARQLGKALAENSITLVYGGGYVGLMGALAQAVLDNGGQTIGIIPEALNRHIEERTGKTAPHPNATTIVVRRFVVAYDVLTLL